MFWQGSFPVHRRETKEKSLSSLSIILLVLAGLLLTGCPLSGTKLTSNVTTVEPHLTWNGSDFGIVYYEVTTEYGSYILQINAMIVEDNGKVVKSKKGLAKIEHGYTTFLLSDLVWNDDNKQFAFAYSKDNAIHFVRLSCS